MISFQSLPDSRLNDRAHHSVNLLLQNPSAPLTQVFNNYADLEGFYRFIKNPRVTVKGIMDSIIKETQDSAALDCELVAIHDTTFVNPTLNKKSKRLGGVGIGTHLSLMASSSSPRVYGAASIQFLDRDSKNCRTKSSVEYSRWIKGSSNISKLFNQEVIHLMDREADSYEIFCELQENYQRYVIRICHDRAIEDDYYDKCYAKLDDSPAQGSLEVKVSKRSENALPYSKKVNPPRKERLIKLNYSSTTAVLLRSERAKKELPDECEVNLVRVWEKDPPAGEKPVEWILVTSEPIKAKDEIKKVIKLYRKRWVIEEFFKGLKTGCNIEKKQFEDIESWKKLIAFYMPMTTKILNLRELVEGSINETQKEVLEAITGKTLNNIKDILYAVANLGGHIKYNGPPGWMVLFRGMNQLNLLETGWKLRSD